MLAIYDIDCAVSSFFKDNWWDMGKLRTSLPEDLVQQIINVPIGVAGSMHDVQIWSPAVDRNFTVKSAYNLHFCGSSLQNSFWSFLWSLMNRDHEEN